MWIVFLALRETNIFIQDTFVSNSIGVFRRRSLFHCFEREEDVLLVFLEDWGKGIHYLSLAPLSDLLYQMKTHQNPKVCRAFPLHTLPWQLFHFIALRRPSLLSRDKRLLLGLGIVQKCWGFGTCSFLCLSVVVVRNHFSLLLVGGLRLQLLPFLWLMVVIVQGN